MEFEKVNLQFVIVNKIQKISLDRTCYFMKIFSPKNINNFSKSCILQFLVLLTYFFYDDKENKNYIKFTIV